MRSLARRHTTLLAFSLCVATSTAFVACGSDESNGGPGPVDDGGTEGSVYSGGQTGSGGKGSGGKASGGTSAGGTSSGGTGTGGGDIEDSGPDVISSNGDAEAGVETDAATD